MKRQDGRGKPIYSEKVWNTLKAIGQKLEKLGYKESKKPNQTNLFYKKLEYTENGIAKSGVMFADLRGNQYFPIWDHPQPSVYHKKLSEATYWNEVIILRRSGCDPRYWAYMEPGWSIIEKLHEIPSGYCKRCNQDIVDSIDYDILAQDFQEFYAENEKKKEETGQKIYPEIEANYCPTCREIEYAKTTFQNQYYSPNCKMCGMNEATIEHHYLYNPEVIMNICSLCHGKIHGHKYPNPLWEQKKGEVI